MLAFPQLIMRWLPFSFFLTQLKLVLTLSVEQLEYLTTDSHNYVGVPREKCMARH